MARTGAGFELKRAAESLVACDLLPLVSGLLSRGLRANFAVFAAAVSFGRTGYFRVAVAAAVVRHRVTVLVAVAVTAAADDCFAAAAADHVVLAPMASTCATIAGTVDEGKAGATVLTAFRHEHSAAGALRGGLLDLQRLQDPGFLRRLPGLFLSV